jgi:hypothetical protein
VFLIAIHVFLIAIHVFLIAIHVFLIAIHVFLTPFEMTHVSVITLKLHLATNIKTYRGVEKLHDEQINDLYCSQNFIRVTKSRRMRWARHVARMGEKRGVCTGLVGKSKGERPLGRNERRGEDNIKMDVQEVGWWLRLDRACSG